MVRGQGVGAEEKSQSWSESSACGPAICRRQSARRVGGVPGGLSRGVGGHLVGRKVNGAGVYVRVWRRLD